MADDGKTDTAPAQGLATTSDYVQVFLIEIEMKRGINLQAADLNGKSDPYCRVSAFGRNYTTKTIMKTLNPIWNEKTQFCFFSDPKQLKFEVYDWDKMTKDDFLGDISLSISDYFAEGSKGFSGKLKLVNTKKGEIEVGVICRKLLPIELEIRGQKLYQTLEEQKNTIISQNDSIRQYSDENNNISQDNNLRQEHINSLTTEKSDSGNQLADLRTNIEKLNNSLTVHRQEKSNYDASLKTEKDELNKIKNSIADLKQNIDKYENDNEHLTQEIKTLKQSIDQKKVEIEERKKQAEADAVTAAAAKKKASESNNNNNNTTKSQPKTPDDETPMIDAKGNKNQPANSKCCIIL